MDTLINQDIATSVAKLLLQAKAVSINTANPYLYASGLRGPVYTDNRLLISQPGIWKQIIAHYKSAIVDSIGLENIDVLSGTATAAIPHASVLALELNIPMVYVRSAKKDHGKENLIEGEFKPGSKVLIIEDLITTGKSTAQNVEEIREAGGIVTDCVAITTSNMNAFVAKIEELKITAHTLTNIQTVIDMAKETQQISAAEYQSVQDFLADPVNWFNNR